MKQLSFYYTKYMEEFKEGFNIDPAINIGEFT